MFFLWKKALASRAEIDAPAIFAVNALRATANRTGEAGKLQLAQGAHQFFELGVGDLLGMRSGFHRVTSFDLWGNKQNVCSVF
jgi:hypothetical protein